MESGLLRQRRNLISISSVLIVYDFAEIKIRQVGWMGSSIEVGNPAALSFIVWVVWFYFFLRYYQYWSSEKDARVLQDLSGLTQNRAIRYCRKKYNLDSNYGWDGSISLERKRLFRWRVEKAELLTKKGSNVAESFSVPVVFLMWWSFVEFLGYCFHKKHMSEHVLPFVLAISALLVKVYSMLQ